jgi:hypothetical protein
MLTPASMAQGAEVGMTTKKSFSQDDALLPRLLLHSRE